jgi:hypothetical protein
VESLFLTVNEWIVAGTAIAALGCFLWGMISVVFSPCHLASIPLIVAYVGGQQQILRSRHAAQYAVAFTVGLFITIALVGIVCAILGRMLGDVGNYWQVVVGLVLVWVALGMFGVEKCSMSGSFLYRLKLHGIHGAFFLGAGLRHSFRVLHIWFHCPDPCDHHHSTKDRHRNSFHPPFRHWALHSYCGGGELNCFRERGHGKQPMARRRGLVPKGGCGRDLPHRPLFHHQSLPLNIGVLDHAFEKLHEGNLQTRVQPELSVPPLYCSS